MNLTESQRTTASSTVEQWSVYLDQLHARIAHRFRRPELKERVQRYLTGLLAEIQGTNGWQMAQAIGEAQPRSTQRILNGTRWDAEAVRDDLREYVVEHLGHKDSGVLIVDETGFLKKGENPWASVASTRAPQAEGKLPDWPLHGLCFREGLSVGGS